MKRFAIRVLAGGIASLAVTGEPTPVPGLTAEQIVTKNVAGAHATARVPGVQ